MPDVDFRSLLEAISQLSTEVLFAIMLYHLERAAEDVVFSLDLLVILLTLFVQRVAAKHLTVRPMAQRLGLSTYLSNQELDAIETLFRRGLEAERAHLARRGPPRPP